MSLRLKIVQFYCPAFIKKQKLVDLFNLTAQAFEADPPHLSRKSLDECRLHYALFTKAAAENVLQNTNISQKTVKNNLYRHTYKLGQKIKKQLGLQNLDDVMKASRFLYSVLGIVFEGNQNGEIIIKKCYFSKFYSSQICELISALDEGMLAGMSGGGKLTFCQRITEGKDCCKANFKFNGNEA
jgi:hypothetical protein